MAGVEGGVERMRAMRSSSLIGLDVSMQDTPSLGGLLAVAEFIRTD